MIYNGWSLAFGKKRKEIKKGKVNHIKTIIKALTNGIWTEPHESITHGHQKI